tara:strand:+ start:1136 stop:1492 length:357 start_codon:yes stop_codon:yes gene_type:complete
MTKINENTELRLDLKTIISIIVVTASFVGMYFTLQSDIEVAKQMPASEINRIEYDLKHEAYENRLDQLEETVEIIFKLGIELDKELHVLDEDYTSSLDSKIREVESKIKATRNKKKRR